MAKHHGFSQSTTTNKILLTLGSLLGLDFVVLRCGCSLIWVLGFDKGGIFGLGVVVGRWWVARRLCLV